MDIAQISVNCFFDKCAIPTYLRSVTFIVYDFYNANNVFTYLP